MGKQSIVSGDKLRNNLKPNKNSKYSQGYYKCLNPHKYIGDFERIHYRSSLEHRFCYYCDTNTDVICWSSEPIGIKYFSPVDNKEHYYYIDFYIKVVKEETESEFFVEVKPESKTKQPVPPKKATTKSINNYNNALKEYIINMTKFDAATKYANDFGRGFILVTENFFNAKS